MYVYNNITFDLLGKLFPYGCEADAMSAPRIVKLNDPRVVPGVYHRGEVGHVQDHHGVRTVVEGGRGRQEARGEVKQEEGEEAASHPHDC